MFGRLRTCSNETRNRGNGTRICGTTRPQPRIRSSWVECPRYIDDVRPHAGMPERAALTAKPPQQDSRPDGNRKAWLRLLAAIRCRSLLGDSDAEMDQDDDSSEVPITDTIPIQQRWQTRQRGRKSSGLVEGDFTPVHRACLGFAISLLDQRVLQSEYDRSPFLDVRFGHPGRQIGRELEDTGCLLYYPITHDGGQRYASDRRMGCPDMVEWVMNHFMIRGTNGPMQRVLDLRTRCLQFNKL
ncbi:hypothetical protein V8E54_008560 [Elaphomyces granulatus]